MKLKRHSYKFHVNFLLKIFTFSVLRNYLFTVVSPFQRRLWFSGRLDLELGGESFDSGDRLQCRQEARLLLFLFYLDVRGPGDFSMFVRSDQGVSTGVLGPCLVDRQTHEAVRLVDELDLLRRPQRQTILEPLELRTRERNYLSL